MTKQKNLDLPAKIRWVEEITKSIKYDVEEAIRIETLLESGNQFVTNDLMSTPTYSAHGYNATRRSLVSYFTLRQATAFWSPLFEDTPKSAQ